MNSLEYSKVTVSTFFKTVIYIYMLPYSKKLTHNGFNAKIVNAEKIDAVKELLLYFFNEINAVFVSGCSNYMKLMRI